MRTCGFTSWNFFAPLTFLNLHQVKRSLAIGVALFIRVAFGILLLSAVSAALAALTYEIAERLAHTEAVAVLTEAQSQ